MLEEVYTGHLRLEIQMGKAWTCVVRRLEEINKLFRVGWTGMTTMQRAAVGESLSPVNSTLLFMKLRVKLAFWAAYIHRWLIANF